MSSGRDSDATPPFGSPERSTESFRRRPNADREVAAPNRAGSTGPERWLYAGERVVESVSVGTGWLTVTSHRVLWYDPDATGRRFESFHRANVRDLRVETGGDAARLARVPRLLVYGLVALGGWVGMTVTGVESMLTVDAPSTGQLGLVASVLSTAQFGLHALRVGLLVAGVVCVLVALALVGRYVDSRRTRLVVDLGDERVELPTDESSRSPAIDRLRIALDAGE